MAQKVIFEEQTLTLSVESGIGELEIVPAPFTLVEGETYRVVWDGVEHELVCVPDTMLLFTGLPCVSDVVLSEDYEDIVSGTFGIVYGSPEFTGAEGGVVLVIAIGDAESHTLAIYQGAAETPSIILKDRDGNDLQYDGGLPVRLLLEDGTEQTYIPGEAQEKTVAPNFSAGDVVVKPDAGKLLTKVTIPKPEMLIPENIVKDVEIAGITGTAEMPESVETSVALDFSAGDMEVTPEEGKVFSKVAIPTPANLIPANIAEGVDIAGIVGTLVAGGGGGDLKFACGKVSGNDGVLTIEHGLGVIPDLIVIQYTAKVKGSITFAMGVNSALKATLGLLYGGSYAAVNTSGTAITSVQGDPIETETSGPYIHNATETTFSVGSSTYTCTSIFSPIWYAIGGLT